MNVAKSKYWVSRQWKLAISAFVIASIGAFIVSEEMVVKLLSILSAFYFSYLLLAQIRTPLVSIEEGELTVKHIPSAEKKIKLVGTKIIDESYFSNAPKT